MEEVKEFRHIKIGEWFWFRDGFGKKQILMKIEETDGWNCISIAGVRKGQFHNMPIELEKFEVIDICP